VNIAEIISEARSRKDELIKDGLDEADFEEAVTLLESILKKGQT